MINHLAFMFIKGKKNYIYHKMRERERERERERRKNSKYENK